MTTWMEQTFAYWHSGGILLWPIGLVCLGIWGLFLRSRGLLSKTIYEGVQIEEALDKGALGNTAEEIIYGLSSHPGGIAAMVRAAIEDVLCGNVPREAFIAREAECMDLLGRDLVLLAALTVVAPLLGLLGTVIGMIHTFEAVSAIGGDTSTRVAAGISQALITTQFGLIVALPGVFGLARLRRMLRTTEIIVAECRSHVLQVLEQNTVKRAA